MCVCIRERDRGTCAEWYEACCEICENFFFESKVMPSGVLHIVMDSQTVVAAKGRGKSSLRH